MADEGKAASVSFCLVCDDVRKEISGKDTLVGVYSGDIVVEALPATLMIAFYMGIASTHCGVQQLKLRVLLNENCVYEAAARLNLEVNGALCCATPKLLIQCESEGALIVQAAIGDVGEWTTIQRKQVVIQRATAAPPA